MCRKILSMLLAITIVICGVSFVYLKGDAASSKTVTLTFWHTYSDTEAKVFNKKIKSDFEKKYKNIKLKVIRMPYEGLKQQVVQAVAGNSTPDVMRMDIIWVPEFANIRALKEISGMSGFEAIKKRCVSGPLSTVIWKGKYYGLPLNTNTKVAIYNKKLLEMAGYKNGKVPTTKDELINLAQVLKKKGMGKNGLIGIAGTEGWTLSPWFLSLGGTFTDPEYTRASGYVNSPKSIHALEMLVKLYKEGIIGKSILGGQPGTWDGVLKRNEYLVIDDGPWFYSLQKEASDKTIAALMPKGLGGSISVVGGEDIVMFSSTKHPKEAWEFMKYMLTVYPQKTMALEAGLLPTVKDALNDPEVLRNPIIKVYAKQLETAWARIPHPKWEEMNDKISKAFEKAFRQRATPKQCLDELAVQLDKLLKE